MSVCDANDREIAYVNTRARDHAPSIRRREV